MQNCVIASVAQLRRSGLVWSAAVAGGGGEGGGGSGHLSRNLPVAVRLRLLLFVERDTYESLSINLMITHLAVSSGRKGKDIFLYAVQKEKF